MSNIAKNFMNFGGPISHKFEFFTKIICTDLQKVFIAVYFCQQCEFGDSANSSNAHSM